MQHSSKKKAQDEKHVSAEYSTVQQNSDQNYVKERSLLDPLVERQTCYLHNLLLPS
jgi:hypothetical protein